MTRRRYARAAGVAALGILVLGCARPRDAGPTRVIELLPPRLDLGGFTVNQRTTAAVTLRNPGPSSVRFRATTSRARCQWQGLPEGLAAGEVVKVSVACQADLLGPLREQLQLLEAVPSTTLATLTVVGTIEPIVGFDTAFVDLRPAFGTEKSVDVLLVGARARQAFPSLVSAGGKMVRAILLDEGGGQPTRIRITCQGDTVGMHAGSLLLNTGIPEQPTLSLSWGCRVAGTLEVDPATPYFNLRSGDEEGLMIRVRSTQPRFRVKSARVSEGPFLATLLKPNPDGSVPIRVQVVRQAIPDEARSASGKLLIHSNDEREPTKEVPLFGFGKINKSAAP